MKLCHSALLHGEPDVPDFVDEDEEWDEDLVDKYEGEEDDDDETE